jgi:diguanylate cyclase (GGDEF)-like protein
MEREGFAAGAAGGGRRGVCRWPLAGCLLIGDLLPLLGLLPAVRDSSAGTVTAYGLLPLLTLPTVVAAACCRRPVYRAQLVVASAICVLVTVLMPLPAAARALAGLASAGALVAGTIVLRRSRRSLLARLAELRRASITDPLTGVLNRRGLVEQWPELRSAALRDGGVLGIAAIDLDHFKLVNDTFGHAAGDAALRAICRRASAITGTDGVVVRSGGEELLLVTVGDAFRAASELAESLRSRPLEPAVTVSVGVIAIAADRCTGAAELWSAVAGADRALYRAKARGRDRIERAAPWEPRDGTPADGSRAALPAAAPVDPVPSERLPLPERLPVPDAPVALAPVALAPVADAPVALAPVALVPVAGAPVAFDRERHPGPATPPAVRVAAAREPVGRSDRLVYQAIVAWLVVLGVVSAMERAVSGPAAAGGAYGVLALGTVVGAVTLIWLQRVRSAGGLIPVLVLVGAFQPVLILGVPAESRPAALMLSVLPGLLVATRWPRAPLLAQMALTAVCCVLASPVPGRPVGWTAALAVATCAALLGALAVTGAQRRRRDAVQAQLRGRAITDPLTGLGNRRALQAAVLVWPVGHLLLLDLDDFKAVNDRCGHQHGDLLLRSVGHALDRVAAWARNGATAFRIGGDEFVLAGPGPLPDGLSDRVHAAAAELAVTVTLGSASWTSAAPAPLRESLALADRELLRGKRSRVR